MNFNPKEFERFVLRKGDVILNEASGSENEVGKPAVWNEEIPNCCFQNTLIRVRPRPDQVTSGYLYLHLLKDAKSGALGRASKGIGIFHLGAQGLSEWCIRVPSVEEQQVIVTRVGALLQMIEQISSSASTASSQAQSIVSSILAKAFRGELIPQDPAMNSPPLCWTASTPSAATPATAQAEKRVK